MLGYLCHLLSSEDESIATRTFKTIASQNAYNPSLVKQCIFLDSKPKTNYTAHILSDINNASSSLRAMKKTLTSTEQNLMLKEACKHQPVSLASEINWLQFWEAARHRGPFWTKISQIVYKLLTKPLFEERNCHKCDSRIPEDISFSAILLKIMSPTLWTLIVSWPTSAQRTLIQTLNIS